VIGLNSWFWNAVWFICDHVAWLKDINAISRDPLVPLNRLAAVLMQVFQFLFNTRQLAIYYEEESRLLEELDAVRTGAIKNSARTRSLEERTTKLPTAPIDPKCLLDPLQRIQKDLSRVRLARRQLIPAFIKTLGDIVICFDFGFQWNLPELFLNSAGVIGGIAGIYTEILTALAQTSSKIKQQELGKAALPPRR